MLQFSVDLPASLKSALDCEAARSGRTISSVISAALAQYLAKPIHTVFQISTSGALVAGIYDREVSVQTILEHGNFGLGTFANLDGEMVGAPFRMPSNSRRSCTSKQLRSRPHEQTSIWRS